MMTYEASDDEDKESKKSQTFICAFLDELEEEDPMRSGQGKTHRCRLCGAGVTKQKSSTTGLLKHFNTQLPGHREVWRMAMNESKHSKTKFNDEGEVLYQGWSFDEMLESHIWWTSEGEHAA